ncbi:LppU/SCO3897 family protein [Phytohabitans kaempferiae]|uniref:Septum formation-related domain-containing protein n=1 Tax=Phytohabitans kaempferiae TaxID=1620943 RepID=A0ABV6LV69_9ACTN
MTNQPPAPPAPEETAAAESLPQPEKKGGARKVVVAVVGVLAAVLLAVVAVLVVRNVLFPSDPTSEAKEGDCLANLPQAAVGQETEVDNAEIVACDSAEAKYSVVGRVDDVTAEQASTDEVCEPYIAAGAEMRFYAIPAGGSGYVLCLKPA